MDAEVPSYGSAPELVRPNPPGTRIKTTKESDIYAFSLLAWEVCYLPLMPIQTYTKSHQSTAFRWACPFPGYTQVRGDLRVGDRETTAST